MKMVKHEGRDVGRTRKSANQTNLWKTNQKGIAIIYARADEGMGNCGKDMRGDCSKAPEVEIGRSSEYTSVVHTLFGVGDFGAPPFGRRRLSAYRDENDACFTAVEAG